MSNRDNVLKTIDLATKVLNLRLENGPINPQEISVLVEVIKVHREMLKAID